MIPNANTDTMYSLKSDGDWRSLELAVALDYKFVLDTQQGTVQSPLKHVSRGIYLMYFLLNKKRKQPEIKD